MPTVNYLIVCVKSLFCEYNTRVLFTNEQPATGNVQKIQLIDNRISEHKKYMLIQLFTTCYNLAH